VHPHDEVTAEQSASVDAEQSAAGSLTLAFQAERPLEPPQSFSLAEVNEAEIGRAGGGMEPGRASKQKLRISLHDRFASGVHAALHKVYGRWTIGDEKSRNGVFVDGVEIDRCELRDGAVIEIGRSFFIFRSSAKALASSPWLPTWSAGYAERLRDLEQIAGTRNPIVLRGESGTGKELAARAIHARSGRGAFQAVNCAGLPQSLAESELFGYRKGAFSGATEDRLGLIRSADAGTLFLDEIGDLPLPTQGLLLRALQEYEVTPVGGTRPVQVDFRLIAATHRDLEAMANAGTFRADLLARIQGFTLRLPPLRERREDLGHLIASLLQRHAGERAGSIRFSLAAARALAVSIPLSAEGRIDVVQLPGALRAQSPGAKPAQVLSDHPDDRRAELIALLKEHRGNITAVAKSLGRARMQIHRWLRRYQLDAEEYR
jgi:transcriptional regulator of acetoin/glycerol metabolism